MKNLLLRLFSIIATPLLVYLLMQYPLITKDISQSKTLFLAIFGFLSAPLLFGLSRLSTFDDLEELALNKRTQIALYINDIRHALMITFKRVGLLFLLTLATLIVYDFITQSKTELPHPYNTAFIFTVSALISSSIVFFITSVFRVFRLLELIESNRRKVSEWRNQESKRKELIESMRKDLEEPFELDQHLLNFRESVNTPQQQQ